MNDGKAIFSFLRISAFASALFLSACANVDENRVDAALMPDSVAKRILSTYFNEDWLDRPYLEYRERVWCSAGIAGQRRRAEISDLTSATFFGNDGLVIGVEPYIVSPCPAVFQVGVRKFEDAKTLVSALNARGGKIKTILDLSIFGR